MNVPPAEEDTSALAAGIRDRAREMGLSRARPVLASANFNAIFRLCPYPVVARISRVPAPVREALADARRELAVAGHLRQQGIPIAGPAAIVSAGPHLVDGRVVTFWEYVPPTMRPPLPPAEMVRRALAVQEAMRSYKRRLPHLGAWRFSRQAVTFLRTLRGHPATARLLETWDAMDRELETGDPASLRAAHGDLHAGNLLPGPEDWYWTDFEDASRMPAFWDLASLVTNPLLLDGHRSPLWRAARTLPAVERDLPGFLLAVRARAILSTLANTWWAARRAGEGAFAERQLQALEPALVWLVSGARA